MNDFDKTLKHIDRLGNINIACYHCFFIGNYEYDNLNHKDEILLCTNCNNSTCIPICTNSIFYLKKDEEINIILERIHRIYLRKSDISHILQY